MWGGASKSGQVRHWAWKETKFQVYVNTESGRCLFSIFFFHPQPFFLLIYICFHIYHFSHSKPINFPLTYVQLMFNFFNTTYKINAIHNILHLLPLCIFSYHQHSKFQTTQSLVIYVWLINKQKWLSSSLYTLWCTIFGMNHFLLYLLLSNSL